MVIRNLYPTLILGLAALCSFFVLYSRLIGDTTATRKDHPLSLLSTLTTSISTSNHPRNQDSLQQEQQQQQQADGFPRLLITSPCSGSSATVRFSRKILEAHGYKVHVGDEPGVPSRNHFYDAAKANLEAKLKRKPTAREIVIESFKLYNEKAFSRNAILLIKINHVWGETGKELVQMGAKFAYAHRSNIIDRAICVVRDCFQNEKFGHQVYANGTASDSCFSRRKSPEKVQAYINDIGALVDYMTRKQRDDLNRMNNYETYIVPPAEIQTYEELFQFEYTPNQQIFEHSVKAWCKLLGNFINVDESIVRETLRPYQNSLPPLPPHSELIYNYKQVLEAMQRNDSSWMQYIRET